MTALACGHELVPFQIFARREIAVGSPKRSAMMRSVVR